MIKIRTYQAEDAVLLRSIFFDTIRNVNIRDYSLAQVKAWAPDHYEPADWQQRMDAISPYIAELNGEIVGYADIQNDGLIDHFFCHQAYQGRGVGRALMMQILQVAQLREINHIYSHVSITARPFFERYGFVLKKAQQVEVRGQILKNFLLERQVEKSEKGV